ncbi:hypothetical protein H6768_01680 [Candidatus Peribacteria bacterium]|nr:hypothetical protein [Candidatus Peribacteria bacterium]
MVTIGVFPDGSSTTTYAPGEGPNKLPTPETTPTPEAQPEFPPAQPIPLSDSPNSPLAETSAPETTPAPEPESESQPYLGARWDIPGSQPTSEPEPVSTPEPNSRPMGQPAKTETE